MESLDSTHSYIGTELGLFEQATNWKNYLKKHIQPYIGNHVLEVGAGLGATTKVLAYQGCERWVCLEPDVRMANHLRIQLKNKELPSYCEVVQGFVSSSELSDSAFDSILYIDVLEHIENDSHEVQIACERIHPGGYLIVLSPAHNWLYSPFDHSIGHYRRYNKRMLQALTADNTRIIAIEYLDSVGLFASAANRLLLKQSMPTVKQILFWDRCLVPLSRFADPLTMRLIGKSILAIWQKG